MSEGPSGWDWGAVQARMAESECGCPLYTDPYARFLIEAADGVRLTPAHQSGSVATAYIAARTKLFDEFCTTAGANGLDQVVILAAGLDTRAWRLPWISGTVVYDVDELPVLEFKQRALAERRARPAAGYVAVPADLYADWPNPLQRNGFDPSTPTAWLAEGIPSQLPSEPRRRLFDHIDELSAEGSRIAVEAFGPEWVRWLTERGWQVATTPAPDLMRRYRRSPDGIAAVPGTTLIEAAKN